MIDLWYGNAQRFGHLGRPQRWANVLGRVREPGKVRALFYTLNGGERNALSIGPDGHRLAKSGDFNVEIDFEDLAQGENGLRISATDAAGRTHSEDVTIHCTKGVDCPLPYTIDWSSASSIGDVAQVTDGNWRLTPGGIRVVEPYYDRVVSFGDLLWRDYEVSTTVTFHGVREPREGVDGGAGVIHAAIAVRWPGHDDDGRQPRVKWYPLGATAEFRVTPGFDGCSWRILGGDGFRVSSAFRRTIARDIPHAMKHRVESVSEEKTRYRVKLWEASESEPEGWDLEAEKGADDTPSGGALLIAHYTDVTFGNVTVAPVW